MWTCGPPCGWRRNSPRRTRSASQSRCLLLRWRWWTSFPHLELCLFLVPFKTIYVIFFGQRQQDSDLITFVISLNFSHFNGFLFSNVWKVMVCPTCVSCLLVIPTLDSPNIRWFLIVTMLIAMFYTQWMVNLTRRSTSSTRRRWPCPPRRTWSRRSAPWLGTRQGCFFFTPGPYTFQCRARPPHDPPVLGEFEISFPLKIQWPRQPQYTPPFGNWK